MIVTVVKSAQYFVKVCCVGVNNLFSGPTFYGANKTNYRDKTIKDSEVTSMDEIEQVFHL